MPYSTLAVTQWLFHGRSSFGVEGFERAKMKFLPFAKQDLRGQHHIITGANAGLGLATATALADMNASVHLVCRDKDRGEAALKLIKGDDRLKDIHLHIADMSSIESVKEFANIWIESKRPVDVLINNAGAMLQTREVNKDGNEISMATAINGTYLLTSLLLPALLLSKNPRVINISSGGGLTCRLDVDDLNCTKVKYDGTLQYAHAKRAQMHLTEMFARKFPDISFYSMHPGWAATPGVQKSLPDFFDGKFGKLRTSEQGADTIVWLASISPDSLDKSTNNGKFFFDRAIASQHYFLAGTALTKTEEDKLWSNVASLCKHTV
jgi:dehydrogenase/reductase SDR family member 12